MKKQNNGKLRIIPLGGLEQIGMNITAFEYEDSIVVVDCGLAFPEDDMLGIDLVIPDVTYLKDNASKVKGFVITHGHEDHIGALPYVLKEINLPIYTTKLTMGIIENKLKEHNLLRTTKRKVVRHGQSINLGKFRIEFIKTNHSIQDASALAIYSPAGVVIHTGDFKVDYTPVFGDAIDLQRFAEIGKKGVLALMSDSTNAERRGFTQSEKTVGITFDHIFAEHQNTRLIIATFASNVDRVQQIINSAYKYGRKVVVEGRSMVNIIATASELGYLDVPENTLIEIDQMKNYPPEKMVLITTGSQGESMAALSRMAADVHRKVTIQPNDTIIFSSNPIPGNEKSVSRVINELSSKGAEVIFQDAHVSGHACQEELKLIYSLVKPKYAIPVHGEYRHLKANAEVAKSLGIPKENVFIIQSGDVLELCDDSAEVVDKVHTGAILVDGLGVGDVGNIVLRDRQHLAEDGIIIVVLTLERRTNPYRGAELRQVGVPRVAASRRAEARGPGRGAVQRPLRLAPPRVRRLHPRRVRAGRQVLRRLPALHQPQQHRVLGIRRAKRRAAHRRVRGPGASRGRHRRFHQQRRAHAGLGALPHARDRRLGHHQGGHGRPVRVLPARRPAQQAAHRHGVLPEHVRRRPRERHRARRHPPHRAAHGPRGHPQGHRDSEPGGVLPHGGQERDHRGGALHVLRQLLHHVARHAHHGCQERRRGHPDRRQGVQRPHGAQLLAHGHPVSA